MKDSTIIDGHPFGNTIEIYGNTQGYAAAASKKTHSLITNNTINNNSNNK